MGKLSYTNILLIASWILLAPHIMQINVEEKHKTFIYFRLTLSLPLLDSRLVLLTNEEEET